MSDNQGNRTPRKLSDEQVREIRALLQSPCNCCGEKMSYRAVGARFGVSGVTVHKIARGKSRIAA